MIDDQIHALMGRAQVAWARIHAATFLMVVEPFQADHLKMVMEMHQSGADYETVVHAAMSELQAIRSELEKFGVELKKGIT